MNILSKVCAIREAAQKTGISANTLINRAKLGTLEARKSGGTWLTTWAAVEEYKKSLTNKL